MGTRAFSKIPVLIIFVIFVVGGFFAWQYFGTPQEKAETPQGIITDETADWQTYRNEQYGFEIKYPPDWKFDAGKRIITFCGPESWQKSGDCLMAGMGSDAAITLRNDSLDIVRDNFCKENPFNMFCGKILTQKDLIIEGSDGKIFETDADNGTLAALWKKVPTDDRMYELSADELNDLPQHRDVFNQMLSTFRFLEIEREGPFGEEEIKKPLTGKQKERNLTRQAYIRFIWSAMELYFNNNSGFLQSKTMPTSIGNWLAEVPSDPLTKETFGWLDNTMGSNTGCNDQSYCVWAELEGGGYFVLSEAGPQELPVKPTKCPCWHNF